MVACGFNAFGKEEAESSNLSGSTTNTSKSPILLFAPELGHLQASRGHPIR